MASFSCKCGQVNVSFNVDQGRTRVNCCCCDCYQKHEWAAANGGPDLHEGHVNKEKAMWGEHWPARMTVTGKENLTFNRLHQSAVSVNCVAKCCHTLLFVDHPAYQGNVVLLFPEMIQMKNSKHFEKAFINTWTKDWHEDHIHKLDSSLPCCHMGEDGQFTGTGEWGEVMQDMMGRFALPAEGQGGQSVADLLAECGGGVDDLGLEPLKCH
jgi:hypothetical protein